MKKLDNIPTVVSTQTSLIKTRRKSIEKY